MASRRRDDGRLADSEAWFRRRSIRWHHAVLCVVLWRHRAAGAAVSRDRKPDDEAHARCRPITPERLVVRCRRDDSNYYVSRTCVACCDCRRLSALSSIAAAAAADADDDDADEKWHDVMLWWWITLLVTITMKREYVKTSQLNGAGNFVLLKLSKSFISVFIIVNDFWLQVVFFHISCEIVLFRFRLFYFHFMLVSNRPELSKCISWNSM